MTDIDAIFDETPAPTDYYLTRQQARAMMKADAILTRQIVLINLDTTHAYSAVHRDINAQFIYGNVAVYGNYHNLTVIAEKHNDGWVARAWRSTNQAATMQAYKTALGAMKAAIAHLAE